MSFAKRTYSWLITTWFLIRQSMLMLLHTKIKNPVARILVYIGLGLRTIGIKKHGLELILKGRRVNDVPIATSMIRQIVSDEQKRAVEFMTFLQKVDIYVPADYATRVLILKVPSKVDHDVFEKGVIAIKFTETFGPLLRLLNIQLLSKYFRIVLEPSWAGYSLPDILTWTQLSPRRVIVFAPYHDDYMFLSQLESNLIPVTLGPSDWANSEMFRPLSETTKVYDSIYVANYSRFKRVDRYIRAVVRVTRTKPNYRAALVCAGHGNAQRDVHELLAWARNKANIDFFDGVDQTYLNMLFNRSKVNVLLSLREGSNKGLAEGMFSGTPALLLAESVCGNHRHINAETGRVVPDRGLEAALLWFSEHYREFSPRKWAETHISAQASTHALSRELRTLELRAGRPWSTDLRPKINQPEMKYLDSNDDWLLGERPSLLKAFAKGADTAGALRFIRYLSDREQAMRASLQSEATGAP